MLFVYLLGALGDVEGVVAYTLVVVYGVEVLAHVLPLLTVKLFSGDRHEVCADLVLVSVDYILRVRDVIEAVVGVVFQKRK